MKFISGKVSNHTRRIKFGYRATATNLQLLYTKPFTKNCHLFTFLQREPLQTDYIKLADEVNYDYINQLTM
jgi:hypothetical protein